MNSWLKPFIYGRKTLSLDDFNGEFYQIFKDKKKKNPTNLTSNLT